MTTVSNKAFSPIRGETPISSWDPAQWLPSPIFEPLSVLLAQLPAGSFPSLNDLNQLLRLQTYPIRTANDIPVRFVRPAGHGRYEYFIYHTGGVPTRPDNLHDLFNALVWLAFPQTKAAINALHVRYMGEHPDQPDGSGRGDIRDVLTLLDESGVIIVCREPELIRLLRGFRWKTLFWERRETLRSNLHCCVFGHNIFEKAVTPYIGLTAKALIITVTDDFFRQSRLMQNAFIDTRLAACLNDEQWMNSTSTRHLHPFPLLGMPGWWPGNQDAGFYDNTGYFRSGRRHKNNGN